MKNSGSKQAFLLYKDRKPLVDACTVEQAGELFKGIYSYVCGDGAPEFDDPLIGGIFEMFRQTIDENDEAWNKKREKAAESIRKRWGGQKPETKPEQPQQKDHGGEAAEKVQEDPEPKKAKEQTPKEAPKKEPQTQGQKSMARVILNACIGAYPISKELQETVESWLKYKTERRESYKEQGLRALIKKASQAEKEFGTAAVIDVIESSIANRYQGITWDRIGGRASPKSGPVKKNQFTSMENQQNYDFDAIEKELLGDP